VDVDLAIAVSVSLVLRLPGGLTEQITVRPQIVALIRWDEKAGLRRDAVRSQVIDVLEAQEIKETGNEEA